MKNYYDGEIIKTEISPVVTMYERWEKIGEDVFRYRKYTLQDNWVIQKTPYHQIPIIIYKPNEIINK